MLLIGLTASNLAVIYLTRNSIPKKVLARSVASRSDRVVALGNSLIAAGFDEEAFDRGFKLTPSVGSVNLGLGASTPTEHLLILRSALHAGARPATIVYGFYDFQLTQAEVFRTSDLFGNHAMLYYTEPTFAERFFQESLHDHIEFELMRHIPMLVERGAIWAKIERLRRGLSEQGMPREVNNRFGRAQDFSLLEAPEVSQFASDCASTTNSKLNPAVSELIREASYAGIEVVIVEMPMHPYHVETFYRLAAWQQYTNRLRDILAEQGVAFIDASNWIPSEQEFADHLHLSPIGANQFSEELGSRLREP